MGAWGYGLFQSDNDYDIVDQLSEEAGLTKLADDANAANAAKSTQDATKEQKTSADAGAADEDATSETDSTIHYSIYANHNASEEDIAMVRDHLNAGKLNEMIQKRLNLDELNADNYPPTVYVLLILGACAMSLGCNIDPSFKEQLKYMYNDTGLMPDAESQMKKALFGPNGYEYGKPYDFGSLGLHDTAMFGGPNNEATMAAEVEQQEPYGTDVCGGCGQDAEKAGTTLMSCKKCKRKYCGKACQEADWKLHKKVCRASQDGQS